MAVALRCRTRGQAPVIAREVPMGWGGGGAGDGRAVVVTGLRRWCRRWLVWRFWAEAMVPEVAGLVLLG
ncbi:hypothetical protein GCM10022224_068180 [Nonomuraea antimicrobica]|uniref:Uncharacterized protein n=1 Tax=Nonomuraea antimicrobica TaxID=561173 RepID=A0ABP7CNS4_9ACTN